MGKAADEKRYREEVREIVETVVKPRAEQIDREGVFPRENLQALAKHGWNGVLIPEKWGGLGLNHVAFSIAAAEITKRCASTALVYVMHVGAAQTIHLYGNDDQKRRWLKPVQHGLIGTYSTSEKATGGHWWFNLSEAERDGDEYILNAEKIVYDQCRTSRFLCFSNQVPRRPQTDGHQFFHHRREKSGDSSGALGCIGSQGKPQRSHSV